jgi:hypothetical protein
MSDRPYQYALRSGSALAPGATYTTFVAAGENTHDSLVLAHRYLSTKPTSKAVVTHRR